MRISLIFCLLLALSVVGYVYAGPGNFAGGQVCEYTMAFHNEANPPTARPSFFANLVVNATGYFNTGYHYEGNEDPCRAVGAGFVENGIVEFTFDYNAVSYSFIDGDFAYEGPWFQHYPIGDAAKNTELFELVEEYFGRFTFVTNDGVFVPCGDFCIYDTVGNVSYSVQKLVRTTCYDNPIPFVSGTSIQQYFDDGVGQYASGLYYWDVCLGYLTFPQGSQLQNSVSFVNTDGCPFDPCYPTLYWTNAHDQQIYLTDPMCVYGCLHFAPTPQFTGPELQTGLFMRDVFGQGNRLQFVMNYWALPDNRGPVCIYFGYTRINNEFVSEPTDAGYDPIYCGSLAPYGAGPSVLTVELPTTYPPASWCTYVDPFDGQGYDNMHPLIISGNQYSDFIVTSYEIQIMGYADTYACRRSGEAGGSIDILDTNTTLTSWGNQTRTPIDVRQYYITKPSSL